MMLHQIISIAVFILSLVLFCVTLFLPVFSGLRKRFIRIGTGLYVSGTVLIMIIALFRSNVPDVFVWLSEIFIFGFYGFSLGMIIFVTKKFDQTIKNEKIDEEKRNENKQ